MHEDIENQLATIGWSLRELSRRSQYPLHLVRDWGDTPHTQPPPAISKWLEAAVAWHEANPVPMRGAVPQPDK
jgi:lambda repressor-like predicted transcriptional regulator